jgi:hypothetical protein
MFLVRQGGLLWAGAAARSEASCPGLCHMSMRVRPLRRPAVVSCPQVVDDNLGFAKERTVSRLTEMQSGEYLIAHAEQVRAGEARAWVGRVGFERAWGSN